MIFLELVPRDSQQTIDESIQSLQNYSQLSGINIPDIKQLQTRSYNMVDMLLEHNIDALPHIRTKDKSVSDYVEIVERLIQKGLKKILLVSGDSHQDAVFNTSPIELTKALKSKFPQLTVYSAIDPYRQSFEDEVDYAKKKLAAGTDGFFTQPFFDIELVEQYLKEFSQTQLFIGISPVLSQKSYDYWVNVNNVAFPASFELNLKYNCELGKLILSKITHYKQHAYIMPIKIDLFNYLDKLLK